MGKPSPTPLQVVVMIWRGKVRGVFGERELVAACACRRVLRRGSRLRRCHELSVTGCIRALVEETARWQQRFAFSCQQRCLATCAVARCLMQTRGDARC